MFLGHLLLNPIRTSSVISQFFLRRPVVISQFFLRTSVVFLLCTTWTSFFMFVSNAFWCKYLLGYIVSCDATFSCNFVLCEFLRYIGETFVRTIRSMHSILNDILQCFHHVRKKNCNPTNQHTAFKSIYISIYFNKCVQWHYSLLYVCYPCHIYLVDKHWTDLND